MMKFVIMLLLTCCVTLATVLEPQFHNWHTREGSSAGVLVALLGDSRRLFAHQFFAMADAYFHSGFYPTIFDSKNQGSESDLKEESHDKPKGAKEHEEEATFLGAPKDWIDRFGRNFYPTVHTHLHGGNEREMLPWLKISAELDPHEIDAFLTGGYWLRTTLNKPDEAEHFLREGLTANPDSSEILLELGRVNFYNRHNVRLARNIYELALQKWQRHEAAGAKPDPMVHDEILAEIIRTDSALGDLKQELADMEELIKTALGKGSLQTQIDELKAELAKQKP
jgi:tetratricopeptide (TPR) repeat protein